MTTRTDKYRGHSDHAVVPLIAQLEEAEAALEEAQRDHSRAQSAANGARAALDNARTRVDRLVDALDVITGQVGVTVQRDMRARR